MNSKKSNQYNYWKYAFMLPLLFVTVLFLNDPQQAMAATENISADTTSELNEEFNITPEPLVEIETPKAGTTIVTTVVTETPTAKGAPTSIPKNDTPSTSNKDDNDQLEVSENPENELATIIQKTSSDNNDLPSIKINPGAGIPKPNYGSGQLSQSNINSGKALIAACRGGDIAMIESLLDAGAFINYVDPDRGTPLIIASQKGYLEVVELLLSKGADINFIAPNQGTALIASAQNGEVEVVDYLIEKGADVNLESPNQGTPLIAVARSGYVNIAQSLLDNGASINGISPNQGTALIAAADIGYINMVSFLISKGADVNKVSANQGTPLIRAASHGRLNVVKYLVEHGADFNIVVNNENALLRAYYGGKQDVVDYLTSKGAKLE